MNLQQARDARIIRQHGRGATSTLRQKSTILTALYLYGAVAADATSLVAGSGLDGEIAQGAVFQVAGVSGSHTVAARSVAAGGRVSLTFAPGLASSAADGALLTFSQPFGEFVYPRMNGTQAADVENDIQVGISIRVLAYRPDAPAPREGDTLDGLPITKVQAIDAGGGVSRYRLTVGSAP